MRSSRAVASPAVVKVSIEKDQLPVQILTASMTDEQLKLLEDRETFFGQGMPRSTIDGG